MKIIHTDARNQDFVGLCRLLDGHLDELVGGAIKREKFNQFNLLKDIDFVVLIYLDNVAVAGGGLKHYQDATAEIKRIFVRKDYRGRGLSKTLMKELEMQALEKGYRKLVLETGELLVESMNLYRSVGFTIIDNYPPYDRMEESVCMEKLLLKK